MRALAHRQDKVGDARSDFGAEARAVEHAVMPHTGLQPMRLPFRRQVDAKPMRGLGLSDTGNIVELALDREQRNTPDLRRIDRAIAMHHLAFGQRVAHEHRVDGLQIEFGGEIHDGEIFVIKLFVLLRTRLLSQQYFD